jgi:hypothetical protein
MRIYRVRINILNISALKKGDLKLKVAVYETVVGLVIPKGVSGGLDIECYGCAMPND